MSEKIESIQSQCMQI